MDYDEFVAMNASFDEGRWSDKDMELNWKIAQEIAESYTRKFQDNDSPKIGYIVEFSDGFRVHRQAKIVEDVYRGSEHGMLCICENGSSHTQVSQVNRLADRRAKRVSRSPVQQ